MTYVVTADIGVVTIFCGCTHRSANSAMPCYRRLRKSTDRRVENVRIACTDEDGALAALAEISRRFVDERKR